jgi:hypothetical protein
MNARTRVMQVVRSLAVTGLALIPAQVVAAPLILNGGFETGNFLFWEERDQLGSEGDFFIQTGTLSPVLDLAVPPPPEGKFAAMTGQPLCCGSHVLYQDFVVPSGVTEATVRFDLLLNSFDTFVVPSPPTLDASLERSNQQARVDLLLASSDPFSVAAADVLQTLYQTDPNDQTMAGYFTTTFDLTSILAAHAGQTLRLRFAEVDNVSFFNLGVDRVSLEVTAVPEPPSLALLGFGALALIARRHHSRRA